MQACPRLRSVLVYGIVGGKINMFLQILYLLMPIKTHYLASHTTFNRYLLQRGYYSGTLQDRQLCVPTPGRLASAIVGSPGVSVDRLACLA